MSLKLKELELDNIGRFENYRVEFNDDVTHLIGFNGSGKTFTGLYGLWLAVKGLSEVDRGGQLLGDRFQLIGNKKSTADAKVTILDTKYNKKIYISNKISKTGNNIKMEAEDGYPIELNDEWLNNFLNVPFLSAKNFCSLSPKKQAILLGIDVSEYDEKIKQLKSKYTEINTEYRAFGELAEPEKVDTFIDLTELEIFNRQQREKQAKIDQANMRLDQLKYEEKQVFNEIESLKDKLKKAEENLKNIAVKVGDGTKYINELPKPEPEKPLSSIQEQNTKYSAYQKWLNDTSKKLEIKKRLEENQSEQRSIENQKLEYMQSKKFGFSNLTVNEDGELLLNGREIREPNFSRGELELIIAKLHASINPDFKFRFIDDLEILDPKNQKLIIGDLIKAGFQICTAEVGEKAKGDNYIVLQDCKVVNSVQEKLL